MSLFKKEKKQPALYVVLDSNLEEAKKNKKNKFYYPLHDYEVDSARAWAMRQHLWMEISHKNGEYLVYRFSGF